MRLFLLLSLLIISTSVMVEAETCKPTGEVMGKKSPKDQCTENNIFCCKEGKSYPTYKCSPPVSHSTEAVLAINESDIGGPERAGQKAACDGKFHSNDTPVVSLSTGWFNNKKRCGNNITISRNGKSVNALVVDECDSTIGCDEESYYQVPCPYNLVVGSKAVWKALGVPEKDWALMRIEWSDA